MMNEEWKKQMQQKMADFQKPAPEVSWELIEQAVAANKRKAALVPLWTRRAAAAAAAILLVAGAGYMTFFTPQSNSGPTEQPDAPLENIAETIPQTTPQPDEPSAPASQTTSPLNISRIPKYFARTVASDTKDSMNAEKSVADNVVTENVVAENMVEEATDSENSTNKEEEQPKKPETNFRNPTRPFMAWGPDDGKMPERRTTSSAGHRWTAQFHLSNGMEEVGKDIAVNQMLPPSTTLPPILGPGMDIPEPEPFQTYDDVYHRQPIRFGLSLSYRLADRWSVESGVVYTRHSSTYSYRPFVEISMRTEQKLNYIGIPLKLNHLLWSNRHFNVYAAAGGMAEKMVKGERRFTEFSDQSETVEDVKIRPLQFSVNLSVGAEYQITNFLSIYAAPEMNYYFDNGSEVPTFYQDKPLNFGIGVGLRISY